MAYKSFDDVGADPDLQARRDAALNRNQAPPPPPPPQENPIVSGIRSTLQNAAYGIAGAAGSGQTDVGNAFPGGALLDAFTHATRPDIGEQEFSEKRRAASEFITGGHYEGDTLKTDVPLPGFGAFGALADSGLSTVAGLAKNRVLGGAARAAEPVIEAAAGKDIEGPEDLAARIASGNAPQGASQSIRAGAEEAASKNPLRDRMGLSKDAFADVGPDQQAAVKELERITNERQAERLAQQGNAQVAYKKAQEFRAANEGKIPSDDDVAAAIADTGKPSPAQEKLAEPALPQTPRYQVNATNDGAYTMRDTLTGQDHPIAFDSAGAAQKAADSFNENAAKLEIAKTEGATMNPLVDNIAEGKTAGGPASQGRSGPPTFGRKLLDSTIEFLGAARSLDIAGHLPILRQAFLPMLGDMMNLPFTIAQRYQGVEQHFVTAEAFQKLVQGLIASPTGYADMLGDLQSAVRAAGGRTGADSTRELFLGKSMGDLNAIEEGAMNNWVQNIPGFGFLARQGNQGFSLMLNSIRANMYLNMRQIADFTGRKIKPGELENAANILTGRGDIPGQGTAMGDAIAKTMNQVFFGPRLLTSTIQLPLNTAKSVFNVAGDAFRRPLNPKDLNNIRSTVAFVTTGMGIMRWANIGLGLPIGTDPTATDFGRITLPDGKRLDLWGPFNEEARLIAREIAGINKYGVQGQKVPYGQNPIGGPLGAYFRSKLNAGPASMLGDVVNNFKTAGGQDMRDLNPLALGDQGDVARDIMRNPYIPVPFNLREAISAFDLPYPGKTQSTGGSGGLLGAAETGLVVGGGTVIDNPARQVRDGVGNASGDQNYKQDPVLQEFQRLKGLDKDWEGSQAELAAPRTTLGSGKTEIKLDPVSADAFQVAIGKVRSEDIGKLIHSPGYQNASTAQQEKMFKAAVTKADREGTTEFLAHGVIDSKDPKVVQSEAVAGFLHMTSDKDKAYWIALLDRSAKLTPDVVKAINDTQVAMPDKKAPITVEEYRRAAPLVHEYLAHVPYGSDQHPIGTPMDWEAVHQAHIQESNRTDELTRSGMNPSLAAQRAKMETLQTIQSMVQRNLFLNGAAIENPQRVVMRQKYGSTLSKFLGTNPRGTQESGQAYTNFPFSGTESQ